MSLFERAKKAKENKKGFTLVELIVVLVILAILAAIMVPALIGWIDKANEKQLTINGRTVLLAGQSAASEAYGTDGEVTSDDIKAYLKGELKVGDEWSVSFADNKVTGVQYKSGSKMVTYDGTSWTLSTDSAPTVTEGAGPVKSGESGTISGAVVAAPGAGG